MPLAFETRINSGRTPARDDVAGSVVHPLAQLPH